MSIKERIMEAVREIDNVPEITLSVAEAIADEMELFMREVSIYGRC